MAVLCGETSSRRSKGSVHTYTRRCSPSTYFHGDSQFELRDSTWWLPLRLQRKSQPTLFRTAALEWPAGTHLHDAAHPGTPPAMNTDTYTNTSFIVSIQMHSSWSKHFTFHHHIIPGTTISSSNTITLINIPPLVNIISTMQHWQQYGTLSSPFDNNKLR